MAASRNDPAASGGPSAVGGRYLAGLIGGVAGACAAFFLGLGALHATGHLPPPAFSNSLCVDEKLGFMRRHPTSDADLLVIGSSVAWRHFDGAAITGLRPLNGAFCGLRANQAVYVADWLLGREPAVSEVVMIASPQDFGECARTREAVFDRADADRFVYGDAATWPFYVRYFAPVSLLRNARKVRDQREALIALDPLVFDRYADGPMDTDASRPGLYYGAPPPLDDACFAAVDRFARRMHAEGRGFSLVVTPLHPDWKAQQDPDGRFLAEFDRRLHALADAHGARYWNADREWTPPVAAFTDAIHLRWSGAQDFSAALARELDLDDTASPDITRATAAR
ncbi:hypothetical protein [Coralloluteibacterium stylophorae]|uniref:Uncharacterized protein n=1 Tax=Coralloluteibacterium stylophorae TaxID=1776034 RepID=A0A8J8AYK0_9GAMM|nr:hypothetical protein [Coralloluteibacterium stylophorae]MBS7457368.1 hypothetical protein [Coralloluteibacterium stylophorae]